MFERGGGDVGVERVEAGQRAQGVDGGGVEADGIDGLIFGYFDERRHDVFVAALDEQPLGGEAVGHDVALEGGDEVCGAGSRLHCDLAFGRPEACPHVDTSR